MDESPPRLPRSVSAAPLRLAPQTPCQSASGTGAVHADTVRYGHLLGSRPIVAIGDDTRRRRAVRARDRAWSGRRGGDRARAAARGRGARGACRVSARHERPVRAGGADALLRADRPNAAAASSERHPSFRAPPADPGPEPPPGRRDRLCVRSSRSTPGPRTVLHRSVTWPQRQSTRRGTDARSDGAGNARFARSPPSGVGDPGEPSGPLAPCSRRARRVVTSASRPCRSSSTSGTET